MRTKLFSAIAATTLVVSVSACGGGGGGDQGEVADMLMDAASEGGLELDEDCVNDTAAKLSDDDAKKIVDAGPDGDPELSPEAEALADEIFNCVDAGAFVDTILAEFEGDDSVDTDCLREELEGLTSPDEIQDKMFDVMIDCMN